MPKGSAVNNDGHAERASRPARRRCALRDFGRVLGPEPLSHLGNLMVRKPQYFRGLFLLLMGYAWNNQNSGGAIASGAAMVGTRLIGMVLKFGPSLFLNRLKSTARNAGMVFNIAQKRKAFEDHQDRVWQYVFEPESRLLYNAAERRRQWKRDQALDEILTDTVRGLPAWVRHELRCSLGGTQSVVQAMKHAQPASTGIDKTREDFLVSLRHALQNDYDRATQTKTTGLEINAVEDYLRSPILGENDSFPRINFRTNPRLVSARRRVGGFVAFGAGGASRKAQSFSGRWGRVTIKKQEQMRNLWHAMVTNVIVKRTGTAIRRVAKCYPEVEINAQTLLWSGRESDPWILRHEGLTRSIVAARQEMLDQAFGESSERTEVMLERLTRWDEVQAMELRAMLDPEYGDASNSINLFADYKRLGDYPSWLQDIAASMEAAHREQDAFRQWLRVQGEVWAPFLERPREAIQRYIGMHGLLIEQTVRKHCPEHLEQLPLLQERLESRLCDDTELGSEGFPPWMIDACDTCEAQITREARDLFAPVNAGRLRAAGCAFHANENGMRELFSAVCGPVAGSLGDKTSTQALRDGVVRAIVGHQTYTEELREVRLHHAICRVHAAIYEDLVSGLRDVEARPRRRRLVHLALPFSAKLTERRGAPPGGLSGPQPDEQPGIEIGQGIHLADGGGPAEDPTGTT